MFINTDPSPSNTTTFSSGKFIASPKPIDGAKLYDCAKETGCFVTCEDHNIHGGLGSAVAEELAQIYPAPIEYVGVNDVFGQSGEPDELAEYYGIDAEHIVKAAKDVIWRKG